MKIEVNDRELSLLIEALEHYSDDLFILEPVDEVIKLRCELVEIQKEPKP